LGAAAGGHLAVRGDHLPLPLEPLRRRLLRWGGGFIFPNNDPEHFSRQKIWGSLLDGQLFHSFVDHACIVISRM